MKVSDLWLQVTKQDLTLVAVSVIGVT